MNLQDIAKQVKEVKVPLVEQDILDFLKLGDGNIEILGATHQ